MKRLFPRVIFWMLFALPGDTSPGPYQKTDGAIQNKYRCQHDKKSPALRGFFIIRLFQDNNINV